MKTATMSVTKVRIINDKSTKRNESTKCLMGVHAIKCVPVLRPIKANVLSAESDSNGSLRALLPSVNTLTH